MVNRNARCYIYRAKNTPLKILQFVWQIRLEGISISVLLTGSSKYGKMRKKLYLLQHYTAMSYASQINN